MHCSRNSTIAILLVLVTSLGCLTRSQDEVVVYAALDAEFSEPILKQFTADTGVTVRPKFDVESTKSVGLANAIQAEAARPRCDVFWNNEILHTLRLEQQGLLEVYRPSHAEAFPTAFRSPRGTWQGFAGRARVLIVNTNLVKRDEEPTSILDLADGKWKGQAALAKPLFGTTATHAACLFAAWDDDKAKDFFRKLKANDVRVVSGNKQVATDVAAGIFALGITDTDDAVIELEKGSPIKIIYPDSRPDELGTLFIPNTLAIVKGCPHPAAARRLADYLLSPAVEAHLAAGESAQIPLHKSFHGKLRVETPQTIHAMPIDFAAAAGKWEVASTFLRDEFLAP